MREKGIPLLDHPLAFMFYYLVIYGIYLIKLKLSGITFYFIIVYYTRETVASFLFILLLLLTGHYDY